MLSVCVDFVTEGVLTLHIAGKAQEHLVSNINDDSVPFKGFKGQFHFITTKIFFCLFVDTLSIFPYLNNNLSKAIVEGDGET